MKRIRINNDFTFAWAIERNGLPEDLSTAINMVLRARNARGVLQSITDYTVAGNMVSIEVTPDIANVLGKYNFILTYELPDVSLDDMERLCEIDTDAFIIVPRTAEADDSTDLLVTSDMAIGFKGDSAYQVWLEAGNVGTVEDYLEDIKGDSFLYSDFTTEQLEALKVKGDTGNGIQSIALLSTVGKVKTYTITFTDLTTTTFTVTDGADGHSPVITFVGTTIYIDGVAGVDLKGDKGDTGNYGVVEFVVNENMELEQHTLKGDPLDFSIVDGDLVLNEQGQTVNLGTVVIKDTYSYDEKIIGEWVDGKPIYRKVILLSSTDGNIEDITITHNLNIDEYIRMDIASNFNGQDIYSCSPLISSLLSTIQCTMINSDADFIFLENANINSGYTFHLILEYTKLP